jgi:hypothetical protein
MLRRWLLSGLAAVLVGFLAPSVRAQNPNDTGYWLNERHRDRRLWQLDPMSQQPYAGPAERAQWQNYFRMERAYYARFGHPFGSQGIWTQSSFGLTNYPQP